MIDFVTKERSQGLVSPENTAHRLDFLRDYGHALLFDKNGQQIFV